MGKVAGAAVLGRDRAVPPGVVFQKGGDIGQCLTFLILQAVDTMAADAKVIGKVYQHSLHVRSVRAMAVQTRLVLCQRTVFDRGLVGLRLDLAVAAVAQLGHSVMEQLPMICIVGIVAGGAPHVDRHMNELVALHIFPKLIVAPVAKLVHWLRDGARRFGIVRFVADGAGPHLVWGVGPSHVLPGRQGGETGGSGQNKRSAWNHYRDHRDSSLARSEK